VRTWNLTLIEKSFIGFDWRYFNLFVYQCCPYPYGLSSNVWTNITGLVCQLNNVIQLTEVGL
jgi:hypothetical protein